MNGYYLVGAALGFLLYAKGDELMTEAVSHTDAFFQYDALFQKHGRIFRVPWRWLKALAMNESSLGQNPLVKVGLVSTDGLSYGLMQVTVKTASSLLRRPATPDDLNDPETSIMLAAMLLRELVRDPRLPTREYQIKGYNGGPTWATKDDKVKARVALYYERFERNLAKVMEKNPGDELALG